MLKYCNMISFFSLWSPCSLQKNNSRHITTKLWIYLVYINIFLLLCAIGLWQNEMWKTKSNVIQPRLRYFQSVQLFICPFLSLYATLSPLQEYNSLWWLILCGVSVCLSDWRHLLVASSCYNLWVRLLNSTSISLSKLCPPINIIWKLI